jgi:hypothetical protein
MAAAKAAEVLETEHRGRRQEEEGRSEDSAGGSAHEPALE